MLIAQIFPDEFTRGYRGRLRVLNVFPTTLKFMAALRKEVHPCETPLVEYPAAATLALAAGKPLQQFVVDHSLLPFHRAISLKDYDVEHGDPLRANFIEFFGTKVWRQSDAMFCLDCIREDLNKLGYAYWRRSHQLPGVYWCNKHGTQLANNPIGKKAFDDMPSLEMHGDRAFSGHDFQEISKNKTVQRYVDIMNAFLYSSRRPMSLIRARHKIAERAKIHKLRIGMRGRRATLTDRVLDQVPQIWLRALYPSIDDRLPGEFFNPIDNITVGSVINQSYALALSTLFESSNEALNYWFNTDDLPARHNEYRRFGRGNSHAVYVPRCLAGCINEYLRT